MTLRALVVDDSMQLRRSVMYALQRIGDVVCVEAGDGAEAIKKFQASKFDLVLTDINMPVLDGLKLIAHLRADTSNDGLPIIVITTESAEEDRERAMKLGASAYLIKPVKAQEVL
ncbi:MAG TPA: response regulator, partial [Archangium sp.]